MWFEAGLAGIDEKQFKEIKRKVRLESKKVEKKLEAELMAKAGGKVQDVDEDEADEADAVDGAAKQD